MHALFYIPYLRVCLSLFGDSWRCAFFCVASAAHFLNWRNNSMEKRIENKKIAPALRKVISL